MRLVNKIMSASVMMAAISTASASQFYIDNGVNFEADTTVPTKVNATSTGLKDEATLKYQSSTDIVFGADNALSVGDAITTSGGLAVGTIAENSWTSLNPGQVGPFGNADNGFLNDWNVSFTFNDLVGTVAGFDGAFPLLSYTGGTIELLYTTDFGTTLNNFMDLNVTGSSLVGGANLAITGLVDFTSVDAGFNDLMHAADGTSFFDLANALPPVEITFIIDQNTNPAVAVISNTADGINISSNHDGSIAFNVPEPSSVALMGLGLLGLGLRMRGKSTVQS